jgi:uncharacterized protein YbjQ (UPF0145 family)
VEPQPVDGRGSRSPGGSPEGRRPDDILSPATLARLQAARGGPGVSPVFTTTAGPAELAALAAVGLAPLGAVRGSSIHDVGLTVPPTVVSTEVASLTRSLYAARRYAVARLVAAASVLGAVGVVGVEVRHRTRAFGADLIEIVATGTAVTVTAPLDPAGPGPRGATGTLPAASAGGAGAGHAGGGTGGRGGSGGPWTTGLDGPALAVAVRSGLQPVSLVFGTCVHHLGARPSPESEWAGQEIPGWTQAVSDAREVALARLQAEVQRDGADGVVGLRHDELDHGWAGQATEYVVTGSAVRRAAPSPDPTRA